MLTERAPGNKRHHESLSLESASNVLLPLHCPRSLKEDPETTFCQTIMYELLILSLFLRGS